MSALFMNWYRMITIKCSNWSICIWWYCMCLLKWWDCVTCVVEAVVVKALKIYHSSGATTWFSDWMVRWHHVVGVLGSAFTIMPNATSASSCCLTSSFQWLGIEAGVWTAIGLVARSILILMGSPVIMGSSWCEQWLNVDAQNLLRNHCFILLLFSSMGSDGRFSGLLGRGCMGSCMLTLIWWCHLVDMGCGQCFLKGLFCDYHLMWLHLL